ncbi:MAG: alcohol dehydrogenase catalytic domain-containing protein [Phycisphaerales bacterium]
MLGVFRPRKPILGTEFAGVVEAVGDGATRFKVGDAVFGAAKFAKNTGTHCELLAIGEDEAIAPKPEAMSFEEASCVAFGCLTAGYFLRRLGKLKAGERVLIIGASARSVAPRCRSPNTRARRWWGCAVARTRNW